MSRLLIIDDEPVDRERIRRLIGDQHAILEAATAGDGLQMLAAADVDCILLDYRLPDEDGIRVLDRLGLSKHPAPVLMLTSYGTEQGAAEALRHGASDYIAKAELSRGRLQRAIDAAISHGALGAELARNRRELVTAIEQLEGRRSDLTAANVALCSAQRQLRFILDQLPIVHWTTDVDLRVTHLDGAGLHRGAFEVEGPVGAALAFAEGEAADQESLLQAQQKALLGVSVMLRTDNGRHAYQTHVGPLTDDDGRVVGAVGVGLDVTDARNLEHQLRHAVKMEALGRLASGVSHDFNNLLSAILGFAAYARDSLQPDDPAVADLDEVIRAGDRAVDLVRQLLTFSRTQAAVARVLDLGPVVQAALPMLRRLVGEDVSIRYHSADDLWPCRVDPGLLEQVLVNLVVNARDAMPRGGAIDVELGNVTLGEELAHARGHRVGPGAYVALSVSDEGEGMPPAIQDQVFDPFFTTKEAGKGTGLGLSTVYGIVRQAGGTITVYSEVGRGTTLRVYLPRALGVADRAQVELSITPNGDETVLLIEDDASVRAVVLRALQRLGYTVLDAHDGTSALSLARAHPGSIELVLCDVVMPGRAGPEIVAELQRDRPALRVLYMSGYTERTARERGHLPVGAVVIEKPLSPDRLGRAVREAFAHR